MWFLSLSLSLSLSLCVLPLFRNSPERSLSSLCSQVSRALAIPDVVKEQREFRKANGPQGWSPGMKKLTVDAKRRKFEKWLQSRQQQQEVKQEQDLKV